MAGEDEQRRFWTGYQPGFRSTELEVADPEYFGAIDRFRYELEPHIEPFARFAEWAGSDVLEVGCGMATDGARFARAGAAYTGLDQSPAALELARERFRREDLEADFVSGSATALPFADDSFDLVYSFGVIHHFEHTEQAVAEFLRVLRPGGTARVMLYHRSSLNYWLTIMLVRRLLAVAVLVPGVARVLARVTGEREEIFEGHRELLRTHGARYLTDSALFLSNNTDGPGNPLSKVYTARQAQRLFSGFADCHTETRYLNIRIYPGGRRLSASRAGRWLERRAGWHLLIDARA